MVRRMTPKMGSLISSVCWPRLAILSRSKDR
jgi:hypothetical protein